MYCTKRILDDLFWVGADDRRLSCFEGVYGVPEGVSYNSYVLLDEKTVLFDTVDKAVAKTFFENVKHVFCNPAESFALFASLPRITPLCSAGLFSTYFLAKKQL